MAEMITTRDVDKILSLLRRVYGAIVIDMSSALNDINLAFLDLSDTIVEIVTYDSTTIHNTIAVADAFRMIGYPASKVRYLVNRADSPGGIEPSDLERALGRVPEHRVLSDGLLVVQSNNEGVPFVLASPAAPISQDVRRVANELLTFHGIVRPAVASRH
jgi:pilus assembly protein CpaE